MRNLSELKQPDNQPVQISTSELTEQDHELIAKALAVIDQNFDAQTYNHTVGCALRTKSGLAYVGVNCDGVHGSCAEYVAVGSAISTGEREFAAIVAVHRGHPNNVLGPCGNCRQMLFEYCPEIKVIINDETNALIKVTARDLLPFA